MPSIMRFILSFADSNPAIAEKTIDVIAAVLSYIRAEVSKQAMAQQAMPEPITPCP